MTVNTASTWVRIVACDILGRNFWMPVDDILGMVRGASPSVENEDCEEESYKSGGTDCNSGYCPGR